MNILALDASTKRTGWSCYDKEGNLKYGAISCSYEDVEKRILYMKNEIFKLIKLYNIDTVVMEEVRYDATTTRTSKVLNWLQGFLVISLYEYNNKIKIEFLGASTWRSRLKIQGRAVKREIQKQIDIKYVNEHYNLSLLSTQDDEADAIGILTAYNIDENESAF